MAAQNALIGCSTALTAAIAALMLGACASQPAPTYDLVIANGRVIDPASGLDGVRHIGIRSGKIEAVSARRRCR